VAFHAPAFSDRDPDWAALNLLSYLGFSHNSDIYQRLVITEQRVDRLEADLVVSPDPFLFTIGVRLKKLDYLPNVQQQVLQTIENFIATPVEKEKLEAVKQHIRSRFRLSLNNTEAVAAAVARALRAERSVDTIDRLYDLYSRISPEDIQRVAAKYLEAKNRTVVTLTGGQR
jgi:zinc protease